jgi:HlyD family secretion protein
MTHPGPRRATPRGLAPVLVLALALGALGLTACQPKATGDKAQAQARAVSVIAIGPRDMQGGLTASGALVPWEEVDIFPQLTTYRVIKVLVDEGDHVKAGQAVAQLDDTLLREQVAQAQALARQQDVQAQRAEEEADRVKGLDKAGILAQEQIDERRFAAQAAVAQAKAQEAAAADMRNREAMMAVRTPYAGLVYERNVRVGDMGGGTTPWYRIARDGRIELAADVSSDALDKIHAGDKVSVTLADGTLVDGVVRLVSPGVDPTTRLGRVRVSLPVRPDIRAGGFAKGRFLSATRSALALPETAIRYDADGASVLVIGADDRVARVPVTTGQRADGYVELLSGPPAGTRVVQRAAAMLSPGDLVRPVPAT